jgi:wobble nucleotide-excising tRNase
MLTSLTLRSIATYPAEGVTIDGLQPISFIFGSNGSGKTTLSNYIASPQAEEFKDCGMQWTNGERLPVHVYNKRFREANLRQADIPGVFTMGEASVARMEERKDKEEELKALRVTATQQRDKVAEYTGKSEKANVDLTEHVWESLHRKHKEAFAPAFKGAATKAGFRDRLLQEAKSNTAELSTLEELKERAAVAFKGDPAPLEFLPRPQVAPLLELEQDGIWATPIVGKGDVPIAALIGRLENSDWVNTGRGYLTESETCPFCQQPTVTEALRQQLEQFFDESYAQSLKQLSDLRGEYAAEAQRLRELAATTLSTEQRNPHTKLDTEAFAAEVEALRAALDAAIAAMDAKLKEPSRKVELPSVAAPLERVMTRIDTANERISEHNTTVKSIRTERISLTRAVWRYMVEQSATVRTTHAKTIAGLNKSLKEAEERYAATVQQGKLLNAELKELTKGMAGVEASVTEINGILESFGFNNFQLAVSKDAPGCYRIERPDGTPATDTLSEGETTFITFLYFYRLMVGGLTEESINERRLIVIDDPISSLDSNVLFVVSSLLRRHIRDVREGKGNIAQLIILTHNAYFQKQLAIENGRDKEMPHTAYWVLRRQGKWTEVIAHGMKNPVSSTYQLLWNEVRDSNGASAIGAQNAMRRILEYYFTVLGVSGKKLSDLPEQFKDSPRDQLLCEALLSWAHGGSHDIADELHVSDTDDTRERILTIFRKVFEVNGQEGHYGMMMGEADPLESRSGQDHVRTP